MSKKTDSIKKALDLLKDAAQEQKTELQDLIMSEYEDLSQVIAGVKPKLEKTVSDINQRSHDIKDDLLKSTQDEPVKALGIAMGIGFVLGALINRK